MSLRNDILIGRIDCNFEIVELSANKNIKTPTFIRQFLNAPNQIAKSLVVAIKRYNFGARNQLGSSKAETLGCGKNVPKILHGEENFRKKTIENYQNVQSLKESQ